MSRKSTVIFLSFVAVGAVVTQTTSAESLPQPMPPPVEFVNPDSGVKDLFGSSVALSGSRLAVGAVYDDTDGMADAGGLFVYRLQAGQWQLEARPKSDDLAPGDWFSGVALQGSRLLVGASRKANKIGAAYLFENIAGTWTQRAKFGPDLPSASCGDPVGCHLFGGDVALDGDTAMVAAHTENGQRGAVYVFTRNAQGAWVRADRLVPDMEQEDSVFSSAIALQGDTLLAGSQSRVIDGRFRQGAAYFFARDEQGVWSQQLQVTAPDGAASDSFGFSVALDGDTAMVGTINRQSSRGAVYVFARHNGTWNYDTTLVASDGASGEQFGYSILIRGDDAFISKFPGTGNDPANTLNGAVYRFHRSGGSWSEVEHFAPPNASPGDAFGASLALNSRALVVGASYEGTDPGEIADRGAVHLYDVTPADRIFADDFE